MSNATCYERFTSITERAIVNRLIDDLLAAGYRVRVHDGEEFNCDDQTTESGIKANLATAGDDRLYFRKPGVRGPEQAAYDGWIWLIWGNGEDVISDYTANEATEAIVEPILDNI